MNLSPRSGYILFVIGIGFCLLTFGFSVELSGLAQKYPGLYTRLSVSTCLGLE